MLPRTCRRSTFTRPINQSPSGDALVNKLFSWITPLVYQTKSPFELGTLLASMCGRAHAVIEVPRKRKVGRQPPEQSLMWNGLQRFRWGPRRAFLVFFPLYSFWFFFFFWIKLSSKIIFVCFVSEIQHL